MNIKIRLRWRNGIGNIVTGDEHRVRKQMVEEEIEIAVKKTVDDLLFGKTAVQGWTVEIDR